MKTIIRMLAGLMGVFIFSAAFADCEMRDVTQGETQFHKRVFAALKESLPQPPPNWTLAPVREESISGLCADYREGEFEIRVSGKYSYHPPKEEGDRLYAESRKLQAEIDALGQLPPDIKKEYQGWLDKMSEANRASNKAYKEGNKELARKKDAEGEEYSSKGREVRYKYLASVEQQKAQLEAKMSTLDYRGSEVNISLVANAIRPDSPNPKVASEIVVGKTPTPKSPGLKVRNVRAVAEGKAAKREQILAAIDRKKLGSIVQ